MEILGSLVVVRGGSPVLVSIPRQLLLIVEFKVQFGVSQNGSFKVGGFVFVFVLVISKSYFQDDTKGFDGQR